MSKKHFLRLIPSVPFTLDVRNSNGTVDKNEYRLAYDINALELIEDKLGLSPTADIQEVWFGKSTVKKAKILFWAALQVYDEKDLFSGDDGLMAVGNLLTVETMGAAKDACWEAFLTQLAPEKAQGFRDALAEFKKSLATAGEKSPNAESPSPSPVA